MGVFEVIRAIVCWQGLNLLEVFFVTIIILVAMRFKDLFHIAYIESVVSQRFSEESELLRLKF